MIGRDPPLPAAVARRRAAPPPPTSHDQAKPANNLNRHAEQQQRLNSWKAVYLPESVHHRKMCRYALHRRQMIREVNARDSDQGQRGQSMDRPKMPTAELFHTPPYRRMTDLQRIAAAKRLPIVSIQQIPSPGPTSCTTVNRATYSVGRIPLR